MHCVTQHTHFTRAFFTYETSHGFTVQPYPYGLSWANLQKVTSTEQHYVQKNPCTDFQPKLDNKHGRDVKNVTYAIKQCVGNTALIFSKIRGATQEFLRTCPVTDFFQIGRKMLKKILKNCIFMSVNTESFSPHRFSSNPEFPNGFSLEDFQKRISIKSVEEYRNHGLKFIYARQKSTTVTHSKFSRTLCKTLPNRISWKSYKLFSRSL